ncbi:hypothetical protein BC739_005815 [Kutzneria viridogrisea]|uniref:Secreted protein n=2 Tax=Kutzneria TaxID=43356 RepID=W5WDC5_9PSEU|nr:hypothetical protein KALB_2821 [Kutzneria albida DSM 43870]MBA8928598.1 hypothetical protein [Kutzneria viridogrisea]
MITRVGAVPRVPKRLLRALARFGRSSPGKLAGIMSGLLLLCILVATVTASAVQRKGEEITDLAGGSEPLSVAAQDIYRSLSDADAAAASAFLSGGVEPLTTRAQYSADIAQATSALTLAAGTEVAGNPLLTLSTQLPVYTGLVETARANNRQGFPVGAAYLREASGLMRSTLLPAAEQLYRAENARFAQEQDAAARLPVVEILLLLFVVGCLFAVQVYLLRRTNRLLNAGLVVATVAVSLALLWTLTSMVVVSVRMSSARIDGSDQVSVLVQARLAAVQARADETLTLVARGTGQSYQQDFQTASTRLGGADGTGGLLGQARALATDPVVRADLDDAMRYQQSWVKAHAKIRQADDSGQYKQAVDIAIGASDTSSGTLFSQLDGRLVGAISATRGAFSRGAADSLAALTFLRPGLIVLAVIGGIGSVYGCWQRLREYW